MAGLLYLQHAFRLSDEAVVALTWTERSREALEECGLVLRLGAWSLRAVQFSYSRSERAHFEKRSTFIDASIGGTDSTRLHADHELIWASPFDATRLLSHASHSWAVERWSAR